MKEGRRVRVVGRMSVFHLYGSVHILDGLVLRVLNGVRSLEELAPVMHESKGALMGAG